MRRTALLGSAVFALAVAVVAVAAGQVSIWPGNPWPVNKPLPASEYSYVNDGRETFTIAWFVLGDLDDGGAIFCNVMITNMGLGDENATVDMTWIDAKGVDHFVRGEFKPDTFSASKDRFEVKIGDNYLGGDFPNFRLKVSEQNMVADLKITARVASWKPNSGYVYFNGNQKDYYCIRIPAPVADLSGAITLDGKAYTVRGRAYMDHSPVTILPHKYADRWQSLRSLGGEYTVNYLEFRLPKEYGAGLATWILVAKDKQMLFATTNAKLSPGQWETDQATGKAKPMRIGFSGSDAGYSIEGEVRPVNLMEYLDILSKLKPLERTVAGLFAKSHIWRFRSKITATLTLPDGSKVKIEQPGISEILYVGD